MEEKPNLDKKNKRSPKSFDWKIEIKDKIKRRKRVLKLLM